MKAHDMPEERFISILPAAVVLIAGVNWAYQRHLRFYVSPDVRTVFKPHFPVPRVLGRETRGFVVMKFAERIKLPIALLAHVAIAD